MDKLKRTCCFTVHRNLPAGLDSAIWHHVYSHLQPLISQGVCYFGVGGALGFDTLIAEKMLELRAENNQLKIILVLPFRGYQNRWSASQILRASFIEQRADKIVYCCEKASREAFLARNRHLVDCSAYCIGYCTRSTEGTAYTLRYAKAQGLTVWNAAQNGILP